MSELTGVSSVPAIPTDEQKRSYINDLHAGRMPEVDEKIKESLLLGIKELRNRTGMTLLDCKRECEIRQLGMKRDDPVQRELDFWKNLAIHLADCHAATAQYDGTLKSCSKSRRERFAAICDETATAIEHMYYMPRHERSPKDVMERCKDAVKELRRT